MLHIILIANAKSGMLLQNKIAKKKFSGSSFTEIKEPITEAGKTVAMVETAIEDATAAGKAPIVFGDGNVEGADYLNAAIMNILKKYPQATFVLTSGSEHRCDNFENELITQKKASGAIGNALVYHKSQVYLSTNAIIESAFQHAQQCATRKPVRFTQATALVAKEEHLITTQQQKQTTLQTQNMTGRRF